MPDPIESTDIENKSNPLKSREALIEENARLRERLAQAEEAARSREKRLDAMSRVLKIGFWEWDESEDCVVDYSPELATIFGVSYETLHRQYRHQQDFYALIHPDDLQQYQQHTSKPAYLKGASDPDNKFDFRIVRPNGELRYLREVVFDDVENRGELKYTYGVLMDITEQQQALEELTQSEQRYSSLFARLPLGLQEENYSEVKVFIDKLRAEGIEDLEQYFISRPERVRELAATVRTANVNETLVKMHDAESVEQFLQADADQDQWWNEHWAGIYAREFSALASQTPIFISERHDTQVDGQHFETRSTTTIVPGYEDTWERVITTHDDITERRQNERALIETKVAAEKANRAKSEFLSSMSHELRTPLNAILGYSQLLEFDPNTGEEQKSHAFEIKRAGKHLLTLIDQVLDLSRIEAGGLALSMETVSPASVINDSLGWVRKMAQKRGISLEFDAQWMSGLLVRADAIRLKQVVLNLLTNAVKYNRENGKVNIFATQETPDKLRISFSDTGPGISEHRINELFQPFNRLGAEFTGTQGSGIGLVITKQLVELMHGRMGVDSVVGEGSTFWIELEQIECDVQYSPAETSVARLIQSSSKLAQDLKILVAEDNPVNQELIAAQLATLGYQADYADTGYDALSLWENGSYQLLLTDIRMPIMDGYDLIKRIRALGQDKNPNAPIVVLTANAMASDVQRCLDCGANAVLTKPFDLADLQQMLEASPSMSLQSAATQSEFSPAVHKADKAVLDLSLLCRVVGDNIDTHRRVLNAYLDELPRALGEIQQAFAWRNEALLLEQAHKLKSSTRSIGAVDFGNLCAQLEQASHNNNLGDIEATVPLLMQQAQYVKYRIEDYLEQTSSAPLVEHDEQPPKAFGDLDLSVLIVDDDPVMHIVTSLVLEELKVSDTSSALSGPLALEIIAKRLEPVDLVICDLNMPEMDGIEFIRHLAAQKFTGSLVLTSGEDLRILKSAEKLAFEHDLHILGVLEKPITPVKLRDLIGLLDQINTESSMGAAQVFSTEELLQAINGDELDVYFQPKADARTREIVGVEALIRWNHPRLGVLPPYAFVALAEEKNLIYELTQVACKKAMHHAAHLKARGFDLDIAINISVDALQDLAWPDEMAMQAEASGLQPANITLEITESRLMEDTAVGLDILSRLSLKRFKLSIDDFGTGYSSMEQLQRIPFSELKIDRAFVKGAVHDASARAIVESSVMLARKMNMIVVAEGVETEQEWDLLAKLGCDQVQGYFISRPMPAAKFGEWLAHRLKA